MEHLHFLLAKAMYNAVMSILTFFLSQSFVVDVYLRYSPDGKPNFLATVITYAVSAFWHVSVLRVIITKTHQYFLISRGFILVISCSS